jgi:hypothetical protein
MNRYDWSKLDAGWSADFTRHQLRYEEGDEKHTWVSFRELAMWEECKRPFDHPSVFVRAALAQVAKCRVVDNTPLLEAMDRIAVEAGAEDVPQYVCSACGKHGLHLCEKFYPEPPSTKWFYPSQPWRRGPLAAWTLVNISKHDGRLTVVMKRGRGECLIETGVDDEGIWERLGLKVVELDKAKEKSDG